MWLYIYFKLDMQRDFARAWIRAAPRAVERLRLPRIIKLNALRNQCRQFSHCESAFEIPEIHFGVEQPSCSTSASADSSCFTLRTSLHLPVPLKRVWEDFHVPQTLNAITPPHLNFTITTAQPVQMGEGTIIDYRQDASPRSPITILLMPLCTACR